MTNEAIFVKELISSKGKEKAFAKLLNLYQERLYWHIRKLVITHENADDVLQNTFLRIYKSLPNFKQQSSLHTWMYRIAYNESLRFLEKNNKRKSVSINDVNASYLNHLVSDVFFDSNEAQLKLQHILFELPEREREIFQMKYFDDLTFREIEEIINVKESTIKSSYYNTVKHIEKNMFSVQLLEKTQV
ncbi:RNA polymerase sigma factor [Flavivirga abyssicola]|uniref:RNA polymerase sigma factor n=1 Tax=Flavivirga abyssicola TaxID=3063533 RepID=UPI0026DF9297|nr:RNA polymerase sigma factor [Flavivirga sp. MEBiC07777]WVK15020.1 RNA polymerase sigma factor [Flavivirga sp. MEBiC07777]